MSKELATKTRIIGALKGKSMTIVELSKKFNLTRATVREHIRDLIEAGAVERIPNIYFRKHVSYKARRIEGKTLLKDAKMRKNAGDVLFEQGRYATALAEFVAAAEIDPKYADAYYNKALTEFMMNRIDDAKKDADMVLRLQPQSQDAAVLMGCIEEKKKNFKKAKEWYEKALEIYPYYTEAKERLQKLSTKA